MSQLVSSLFVPLGFAPGPLGHRAVLIGLEVWFCLLREWTPASGRLVLAPEADFTEMSVTRPPEL